MTSNQRRPGFRLPWGTGAEGSAPEGEAEEPMATAEPVTRPEATRSGASASSADSAEPPTNEPDAADAASTVAASVAADEGDAPDTVATRTTPASPGASTAAPAAESAPTPRPADTSAGFMRDLVAAMRRVAEETRQSGLSELRTKAEEQVRTLEANAERRRDELKARADRDVAAVGEWETSEAERSKKEAEQRVVARRAQLDQQLAGDTTRAETDVQALRDRVAEYERALDAYHAQLSDIADPAAFATAAKSMPAPPKLDVLSQETAVQPPPVAAPPSAGTPEPTGPTAAAEVSADAEPTWPAESSSRDAEAALNARLAELDAKVAPAATTNGDATTTEVRVTGLGSFGAITGFRQALAAADGIEGVSLSLGPTGEFVFRAVHAAGFDMAGTITAIEGEGATVEAQEDGALRVTLTRAH